MKKCLLLSKVIDENNNWIAEPSTVVIQIGDQLDGIRPMGYDKANNPNGIYDISIMLYLNELHRKAQEKDKNSGVYGIIGNHEMMNVDDPFNTTIYMDPKDIEVFNSKNELMNKLNYEPNEDFNTNRINCFRPGHSCAVFLACTRHSIMKIGSNLFVHAGLVKDFAERYNIHQVNEYVKGWLLGKIDKEIKYDIIRGSTDLTFASSPLWTRLYDIDDIDGFKFEDNKTICQKFDNIRRMYEFDNMIIGHSVQVKGINSVCDKKIWKIDVGLSKCFEGIPNKKIQILEIINDNEFHILE